MNIEHLKGRVRMGVKFAGNRFSAESMHNKFWNLLFSNNNLYLYIYLFFYLFIHLFIYLLIDSYITTYTDILLTYTYY